MSHHEMPATLLNLSTVIATHAATDVASPLRRERRNDMSNRVLIIRPEPALTVDLLSRAYGDRGYRVDSITSSLPREDILRMASLSDITIVELHNDDTLMFELCEWLRQRWKGLLLILTFAFANADIVRVYQMGADGHYPYPCNTRVVMARTEALLRRTRGKLRHPF